MKRIIFTLCLMLFSTTAFAGTLSKQEFILECIRNTCSTFNGQCDPNVQDKCYNLSILLY